MNETTAIYAGTFDPLTVGHCDLVERSAKLFDNVVVGIGIHPKKHPMFLMHERFDMANEVFRNIDNVGVITFDGLLVNAARKVGANTIIRGLRMFSDFESELQMALTNRDLSSDMETVFLTPKHEHSYISSSMVKDIWNSGGDVSRYIPKYVAEILKDYISGKSEKIV